MIDTDNSFVNRSCDRQFHINVRRGDIGEYCILPGDPGRCEKIAALLDSPRHIATNREFNIWNGELLGKTVTVCSTGIGGPSTAIAVEELAACGAHTMIRVGTCGGISLDVEYGDVVIASGAVRQEGTSHEYAPPEFPAVSDTDVLLSLIEAAKASDIRWHAGVVQSKDSFYGQHSPERMPVSSSLSAKWEAWKRLGVLASEMEASTLFVVGAALHIRCGAVFTALWNQERLKSGLDVVESQTHDSSGAIKTAVEALKLLISRDINT